MQSAVSRAKVEELARDAKNALQATAEQSAWDVARLTHETGTTFGRVEATMLDMDSRVESLDDRLFHLQEEQNQQQQRTQATLQSTAALEQQLHMTEQKMQQQADQHQTTLQEQRKYILNLEQMMRVWGALLQSAPLSLSTRNSSDSHSLSDCGVSLTHAL